MGTTTISDALAVLRRGVAACECGEPAGADPVRCTDCGAALCAACSRPDDPADGPLDLCFACAVRVLSGAPVAALECA